MKQVAILLCWDIKQSNKLLVPQSVPYIYHMQGMSRSHLIARTNQIAIGYPLFSLQGHGQGNSANLAKNG
jgi:hypothetical protein